MKAKIEWGGLLANSQILTGGTRISIISTQQKPEWGWEEKGMPNGLDLKKGKISDLPLAVCLVNSICSLCLNLCFLFVKSFPINSSFLPSPLILLRIYYFLPYTGSNSILYMFLNWITNTSVITLMTMYWRLGFICLDLSLMTVSIQR